MSKLYKIAGVSRRNGTFKARFANDMTRVKVLAKTGSSDIDLIELEHAMTKEDAVAFLLKINFDNGNAEVRAALEAEVEKRAPKAPRAPKAEKPAKAAKAPAKKAAKSKPSLDAIAARAKAAPKPTKTKAQVQAELASLEDAPF